MKNFLRVKAWPVAAGLLTAIVIMMIFELGNSLIYPIPNDMDYHDVKAVKAFTATLPWTAYILVFLGWVLGSFKAGCVTTYLSKEKTYRLSLVVGIILTILGVLNNMMIGHAIVFNFIALPMFILFTYFGFTHVNKIIALKASRAIE